MPIITANEVYQNFLSSPDYQQELQELTERTYQYTQNIPDLEAALKDIRKLKLLSKSQVVNIIADNKLLDIDAVIRNNQTYIHRDITEKIPIPQMEPAIIEETYIPVAILKSHHIKWDNSRIVILTKAE